MDNKEYLLSTDDNPYSPFDEFDRWYEFDTYHNYNSLEYIDRIAQTNPNDSEEERSRKVNEAIDQIIKFNPLNIYRKVSKEMYKPNEKVQ